MPTWCVFRKVLKQLRSNQRLVDAQVALVQMQHYLVHFAQCQSFLMLPDRFLEKAQPVVAHSRPQLPPPVFAIRYLLHSSLLQVKIHFKPERTMNSKQESNLQGILH
jgi:hypothetical protein